MPTVNIHDAKTHLSALLADVEKGQTITIARAGKPIATLGPITDQTPPDPDEVFKRRTGLLEDVTIPDDFDTMMADEIRAAFEGEGE